MLLFPQLKFAMVFVLSILVNFMIISISGFFITVFYIFLSRHRSQRSPRIRLYRGRVYFMEALMKEGGGGDHISVGMRIRRRIKPIPGKYLYMVPPGKK